MALKIPIWVCTLVVLLALGVPAHADVTVAFPAGLACEFELLIHIGDSSQVTKTFTDKDGNVVRMLTAGKGPALVFEHGSTGATLELKGNGSVMHTTVHPDGSQTLQATGHNIVILFPTDDPPGPSTTLHVGRVVIGIDANGTFTVHKATGKTTDICAALAD
jgi:hypothetical protein